MSTFGELKSQVLFNAFDAKYSDEAGRRLNAAARQVASRTNWNTTLRPGTVGSDGVVVFASAVEFAKVTGVWRMAASWLPTADSWTTVGDFLADRIMAAGDSRLSAATGWAQNTMYSADTGTGGAQRIRVIGVQPGDQVAVQGCQLPPRMSADADESPFGDDADDALVLYARAKLYLREDDPEMSQLLSAEFERELKTFARLQTPEDDGPVQVAGMWGGVL